MNRRTVQWLALIGVAAVAAGADVPRVYLGEFSPTDLTVDLRRIAAADRL